MSKTPLQSVYVKHHGATVLEDWQRVKLLAHICKKHKGFSTAQPLWIDVERQVIGYEKLRDLVPLLQARSNVAELMHRVGVVIGDLHRTQVAFEWPDLHNRETYPMEFFELDQNTEQILLHTLPSGWFHADCWYGNFFVRDKTIVVIDPLPDGYTIRPGYFFACGAIDIAVMYMSLFLCRPLKNEFRRNWPRLLAAGDGLLDGYLKTVGAEDPETRSAVLRLSRRIAINHVMSYNQRLVAPLAKLKQALGLAIVRRLDNETRW